MPEFDWLSLLDQLEIVDGQDELHPAELHSLTAAESHLGVKLPESYRAFCSIFGAGSFGRGDFNISVPGYEGAHVTYSLEYLTESQRELAGQFGELGLDSNQIRRGVFFALDMAGTNHFFDPDDVTDAARHEYAVYSLFRNYEIERTFESFSDFITTGCLGEKRQHLLLLEDSPERSFKPISQ